MTATTAETATIAATMVGRRGHVRHPGDFFLTYSHPNPPSKGIDRSGVAGAMGM
jgi:hypothetical protein